MKKKIFTLSIITMFFAFVCNTKADVVVVDAYGGEVNIMGQVWAVPDFTKWYYFSFETGEVVGTSDFVLEDLNAGNVGTEVPNAEWAARTDWDIAFHATDIRTNGLEAILVADTTSEKSLDEVFAALTVAPTQGFKTDEVLSGVFIGAMSSMPPPRATQMSVCEATNGWAVFGMSGSTGLNQKVVVFKLANDKYVKVYLQAFFSEEGLPGFIKFEYAEIDSPTSNLNIDETRISVYPNPATDVVNVVLPDSENQTPVYFYNLSGALIKQVNAQAGVNAISVSDLPGGMYIVKANHLSKKIIIK